MNDVSDILRDRMQEPVGLQRMAAVSAAIHLCVIAVMIFAPGGLLSRRDEAPRTVMTITLGGGTPGPQNGGMTAIGGRPVQAEPLPEAPKRPEAIRPPAAAPPEMILPVPGKPTKAA